MVWRLCFVYQHTYKLGQWTTTLSINTRCLSTIILRKTKQGSNHWHHCLHVTPDSMDWLTSLPGASPTQKTGNSEHSEPPGERHLIALHNGPDYWLTLHLAPRASLHASQRPSKEHDFCVKLYLIAYPSERNFLTGITFSQAIFLK